MELNFGCVLRLMDFFYHESARIFTNVVEVVGKEGFRVHVPRFQRFVMRVAFS